MKTNKRRPFSGAKVKKAKKIPVSESALQAEFLRFMEYHPAHRVNRNLRKMLLEFMMLDAAVEAFYLKDLLYDLEGLFELLDAIEADPACTKAQAGGARLRD
jgi:hypothetical protein